jgi:hypothetical protein
MDDNGHGNGHRKQDRSDLKEARRPAATCPLRAHIRIIICRTFILEDGTMRLRTLLLATICAAGTLDAQTPRRDLSVSPYVPSLSPLVRARASDLRDVVDRYIVDRAALLRRYDAPYSPARRTQLRSFYSGWRTALRELSFEDLGQGGRVDAVLLDKQTEYEQRLLDREDRVLVETTALIPFLDAIFDLHEARRRHEGADARGAASTLVKLAERVESTKQAVEAGIADGKPATTSTNGHPPVPIKTTKIVAFRAADIVEDGRKTLKDWYEYRAGYDPLFGWWAEVPFKKADAALGAYIKTLREKVVGIKEGEDDPIIGDPIGLQGLNEDLEHELIPYSPEQLIRLAEREFKALEAEMLKASRDMGFGDDWRAAIEKVKNDHVEPGKQPDLIRDLAREAVDYVETHGLVTVPPLARDIWRMQMMSPERQKVSPFFLGGEVIQVSYPTDTMEHDDKLMSLRGNNRHFSRATVFHELIPGHHLQGFMTDRYSQHRRTFNTPFWTEGWSLYWEMLLWDMGFHDTPERRVGALFWRMHRAARIIFSLNFHLGKMTPQEAIDFLVDRVGHERANAQAEVRRSFNGSYSPLYQAAYMLGGLQFRSLQQDLVQGGRMSNRDFHDTILQSGRMPVEMVRATLTNAPLAREYKATWRFAGEL